MKGSLIRFAIFWLWAPIWPPEGVKWWVEWGSKVDLTPIFTKFGGKEPFCKLLIDPLLDFWFSYFEPPIWPPEGSNGGPMGVKSQCSSDSHHIGREGAFLQVIKESFMIFLIFLLWVPHLTPWRGQGGRMGVKIDLGSNVNQIWW